MKIIVLVRSPRAAPESDETLPGLSPGDRAALATGLALREEGDEVIAMAAGPPADDQALQLALRAGAGQALRIIDPAVREADLRTLATVLAGGLRKTGFDLILAGQRSADWASGGTGPAVAHMLRIPHVTSVTRVERAADGELQLTQRRERTSLHLVLRPPVLIAVTHGPQLTAEKTPSDTSVEGLSLAEMTLPFRRPLLCTDREIRPIAGPTAKMLETVEGLVDLLRQWR